jgi:hypothetical protein
MIGKSQQQRGFALRTGKGKDAQSLGSSLHAFKSAPQQSS